MKKTRKTSSWKEKNVQLWGKMVSTYLALKSTPSTKLILKFITLILRVILSIVVRKIFLQIFPNF